MLGGCRVYVARDAEEGAIPVRNELLEPHGWLQILGPLVVVAALVAGARAGAGAARRAMVLVLLSLGAGLAVANHYGLSIVGERDYFNEYEFYHYYLSTKYAAEVGYFDLYSATLAADQELGHPLVSRARDLREDRIVDAMPVLARGLLARDRFSEERWREWRGDVAYFRGHMSSDAWEKALRDRGYNGTPVWTMIWGAVAERAPTTDEARLRALPYIDVVIWLASFAAVCWAFGARAALIVIAMFGFQFVANWHPLRAAYVRVEWIAALLAAMSFVKRGRHATAGVLVGLATLSRIFPVYCAFGAVVSLAWTGWRERRLDREAARFLLAMALTVVSLSAASLAATSVSYWREFLDKISHLSAVVSSWRVGFDHVYTLAWDGTAYGGAPLEEFLAAHPLIRLLPRALAVAGVAALVPRLRERWEQLMLGFVLSFFLMELLYYYYLMLLVPALWLASRSERPAGAAGLTWMFVSSSLATLAWQRWDRGYETFFVVSCSVFLLIVGIVWMILREARAAGAPRAPAGSLELSPPGRAAPSAS